MALEKVFTTVAGLSTKSLIGIGFPVSSVLGAAEGFALTNQWPLAGLAGAVSGILTTGFLALPKIMEQRRKARESSADLRQDREELIWKRLTSLHAAELDFYKRQVSEKDLVSTIERNAKHAFNTEYGSAVIHIRTLEAQLQDKGITPWRRFTEKTYAEIAGDADAKIEAIKMRSHSGALDYMDKAATASAAYAAADCA